MYDRSHFTTPELIMRSGSKHDCFASDVSVLLVLVQMAICPLPDHPDVVAWFGQSVAFICAVLVLSA